MCGGSDITTHGTLQWFGPRKWLLSDLSEEFRATLATEKRKANKRICGFCGKTSEENKMRACAGCLAYRLGIPAYYCNRDCQKEAWDSHMHCCGRDEISTFMFNKVDPKSCRRASRQMHPRIEGTHSLLCWATMMVLLSCPGLDERSTSVRFIFKGLSIPTDPWILERIELVQVDWTSEDLFWQCWEVGSSRLYQLCFGSRVLQHMTILEDFAASCYHYTKYTPQWPWILAQICLCGGTNGWITYHRLGLVIARMEDTAPHSPFQKWQNRFRAPTDPAKFPWSLSKFDQWQAKMKDILPF